MDLTEIINNIPQMVWEINNRGDILYSNTKWNKYTSVTNIFDINFQHPDDIQKVKDIWDKSSNIFTVKRRLKNNYNIYRWFLTKATKIKNDHWVGMCLDIEEIISLSLSITHYPCL